MYSDEVVVGQTAEFRKTVTETDVVLFAGITGDLNPAHIAEVATSASPVRGARRARRWWRVRPW